MAKKPSKKTKNAKADVDLIESRLKNVDEQLQMKNSLLKALSKAQTQFINCNDIRLIFEYLLNEILDLTGSEYGFIGEVLYNDKHDPYLKIYAITDISWNEESRNFYEENAPAGLEFYNMNTLFGHVITDEKTVISNDPAADPRSGGLPKGHPPLNSFLGIPFLMGEQLIGMVGLANRPGGYDEKLVEYLQPFVNVSTGIIQAHRIEKNRRETEDILFESQQKYQSLFDKATDYIVLIDSKGYVLELNEKIEPGLGYKRKDIIGKHIMELPYLSEEGKKKVVKKSSKRLEGGQVPAYELDFHAIDGRMLIGEVNATLVQLRDGTKGDLVIIRDITERKKYEEEIKQKSSDLERFSSSIKQLHRIATTQYDNIDDLLSSYLKAGKKIFGLPTGIISRIEGNTYKVLATVSDFDFLESGMEFELKDTYCNQVIETNTTIAFSSATEIAGKNIHPIIPIEYFESYISAPIYVGGEIYGTLNFSSPKKKNSPFLAYEYEIIELMAESIGQFIVFQKSELHRREIEAALRNSEIRNRTMIDTAVDAIITIDHRGIIESVNQAFTKIFGYKGDEVIGKNVNMIMPEPFHSEHDKYLKNYRKTGKRKVIGIGREVTARHKTRRTFPIDLAVSEMKLGDQVMFTGIIRDITERKEVENNLRLSKQRLAKAQELAHIGNWEWNVKTNDLFWSDEIYRIFGFNLIEKHATYEKYLSTIHPDDRETLDYVIKSAVENGNPYNLEHRIIRPDGTERIVFSQGEASVNESGQVEKLFGTVQDITERKKVELERNKLFRILEAKTNELNAILDSVGDAIVSLAENHAISSVNQAFLELFDLKEEDVIGKDCDKVLKSVDKSTHYDRSIDVLVDGGARTVSRNRFKNKEGKDVTVETINSPLRDSDGNVVGAVKSIRDVTKEAEIDRMKTEFISMVSHELRTPLTSIKGYIDLILSGDTGDVNELQQEFLEIVFENSERLNNLINDLLDVEKIETGKVEMKFSDVSLSSIVNIAAKTMKAAADKKGLKLVADIQENVEYMGDKERLVQVVANLISNAVKYTKQGTITVSLHVKNGRPEITIKDTGIGITKGNQKKLFNKFFRADNDYTREVGGTGLGLSIVKAIVKKHRGEIDVKSVINKGSEFTVSFPPLSK